MIDLFSHGEIESEEGKVDKEEGGQGCAGSRGREEDFGGEEGGSMTHILFREF